MEEEKLIIDVETEEERRIDQFLADQMEYSRSFIQKLIKNEKVTVNGNVITKVKYPVSFRDKIIIEIPAPTELEIKPEKMDLDILYEDNDVIVIDKPKGMVVHPSAGHMSHTLVNGLLYHCKGNLSGINGVLRPGIVHRIDMDTTGAIIACKNDIAHQSLAKQLQVHSITRKYEAIVYHNLQEETGTIDKPIGRHPVHRNHEADDHHAEEFEEMEAYKGRGTCVPGLRIVIPPPRPLIFHRQSIGAQKEEYRHAIMAEEGEQVHGEPCVGTSQRMA